MAHDDGAPRRPPPPRPDPVHQRVIDFDVTTSDDEGGEGREPVRGNWTMWLLLMAAVVLAAAVWMVSQIPLEPVPVPSPQLPPGAEDVGHPLDQD